MALPHLVQVQKKFARKGFVVVSISLDKEAERDKFKEFVKEHEMNWPHIMDGKFWEAKLAKKMGVRGIPAVFLVDPNGKCIGDSRSLMVHDEDAFAEKIEAALKETPPTKTALLPMMKKWVAEDEKEQKAREEAERKEREAEEKEKYAAAEKLLKQKKYTDAIKAFEKLGELYPDDELCQKAAEKAKSLKADKKVTFAIMSAEADRRAPGMMKMAKQLASNGNTDKARQYYQMVIDKYPGTRHAEEAKAAKEALGS